MTDEKRYILIYIYDTCLICAMDVNNCDDKSSAVEPFISWFFILP